MHSETSFVIPKMEYTRIGVTSDVTLAVSVGPAPGKYGIVYIHGILQAALSWKYQLGSPKLAQWTSVAFDLRGHGFSSKPQEPRNYNSGDSWSSDLKAVLDWSGLERVILVGWSFGGRIMLDYLERNENDKRIAGLVFIDANTKSAPGHVSQECLDVLIRAKSANMADNIAARAKFVDMCFERSPSEADLAEILAYNNMMPPQALEATMGRAMDHDGLMRRLRHPTVVIHGQNDRLSLVASGRHTASTIPDARLRVLEGIGHTPQVEASDEVNAILADFAAEIFA
ncbi:MULTISPECIES: alpha/beta fold hydrolase [unclassified Shinella]|uniref:alpha/beta fold hydrolase n=1 Tax=unclassified Shinella TaxID=2643062 RepID=UPI00225D6253|nr:alpha/beta hydrolase [Shinella sp. YE25]MDC7259683.1 alpha/beta hydrolase [Shinella sp. YE25]CAI0334103.1 Pimeloyl-ACP methyl ester carboxylesterase [Rhizobiaceae bacterium]CAK7261756.1 Pimeloyl-ACP methyl ester carboxylesterase [Shinella sp. WSC3-e]